MVVDDQKQKLFKPMRVAFKLAECESDLINNQQPVIPSLI